MTTLPTFGDRVQETFTTTGTGTISLGGAVTGYQAFSAVVSNAGTCYYAATDGTNWEVGLGTYATSGDTLARTTILASSNSGSAVSWSSGTKNIWLDLPAAWLTQPTATTQSAGDNSTKVATTAYVNNVAVATTPTIQSFTSGSGTYTTPAGVKWIEVRMIGGGAGGWSSNQGNSGTAGGNTTFGTSLLVADGGAVAASGSGNGGLGGSFSLGGVPGFGIAGGQGGGSLYAGYASGSTGGSSAFGGAGGGGATGNAGGSAATNSGGGGGGGGVGGSPQNGGPGGGAGGYVEAIIVNPLTSYSYAVGAGGSGGTGGTDLGGAGGSGIVTVEEHYNY